MKKSDDISRLPSDLFSRNYLISKGIKKYKRDEGIERAKILDIGGRNGFLHLFLDKKDELTLIDIREGPEENLIIGDATNMRNFPDDSFDVITSGDVFEHVSEDKREKFLNESLRVSKGLVVIAAPFWSKENEQIEKVANSYYRSLVGEDHEWLAEHIKNGLPKAERLMTFLKKNKLNYSVVGSNNIDNWLLLQLVIFYSFIFGVNSKTVEEFYKFYNENLLNIENKKESFYRKVFFITEQKFEVSVDYDFIIRTKVDLQVNAFKLVAKALESKNRNIQELIGFIEKQKSFYEQKLSASK